MKQSIHTPLFVLLLNITAGVYAQPCDVYPADCPHEESIKAAKDRDIAASNRLLPQEMDMMDRTRKFFTDYFGGLAALQHWQLYEFNEDYAVAACAKQSDVPYLLKSPCTYNISFLVIVNKDTMAAWKKWADDFKEKLIRQGDAATQSFQNNDPANDPTTKKYIDSAEYYGNLKNKYIEQHAQQYANDIQKNNQNGIKEFENSSARYDKIITAFTSKAYGNTSNNLQLLEQQTDKNQLEERTQTRRFRDAATLLIHISINAPLENSGISDPATQKYLLPQKKWLLPGTTSGGLLHNTLPMAKERLRSDGDYDMDYVYPTDMGILFFGSWLPVESRYNMFQAGYTANRVNTDCVSVKKNNCDKIQVMTIHLEGNANNITHFINLLDTQKLNGLLVKQP